MGKFLKVVVVILLLVSVGAAFLAYMNYEKRNMLVGRTDKLEKAIETLATTLNASDPAAPEILPDFVAKDVSDVQAREIATPDTSDFWDDYKVEYETTDIPKMNIRHNVSLPNGMSIPQIKNYYFLDGEGKRVQTFDGYQTTGKDTMAELLDSVQARASAQAHLLTSVSSELKKVREELENTINELNTQKKLRRQDLVKIEDLKDQIAKLEQEKADLEADKTRLEADKARLTDERNDLQQQLAKQQEDFASLQKRFAELEKRYKELFEGIQQGGEDETVASAQQGAVVAGKSTPGKKGTIVYADPNWPFVLIKLTPEAIAELTSTSQDGSPLTRPEEYMVRRQGLESPAGDFVTRVKIQSIRRDGSNIAIADNLTTWQQVAPVRGDVVFF